MTFYMYVLFLVFAVETRCSHLLSSSSFSIDVSHTQQYTYWVSKIFEMITLGEHKVLTSTARNRICT